MMSIIESIFFHILRQTLIGKIKKSREAQSTSSSILLSRSRVKPRILTHYTIVRIIEILKWVQIVNDSVI